MGWRGQGGDEVNQVCGLGCACYACVYAMCHDREKSRQMQLCEVIKKKKSTSFFICLIRVVLVILSQTHCVFTVTVHGYVWVEELLLNTQRPFFLFRRKSPVAVNG